MTDKEKFRKEVEKLKSNLIYGACSSQIAMETMCKEEAYNEVLAILDTMQEEPKQCMYSRDNYTEEDRKVLCEGCEEKCEFNQVKESAILQHKEKSCKENGNSLTQETVSEVWHDAQTERPQAKEKILATNEYGDCEVDFAINMALYWPKVIKWAYIEDLLNLSNVEQTAKNCKEPVSEDLEDAAYKFVMDNFGNPKEPLYKFDQRCFKAGANWQKKRAYIPLSDDINEVARQICNKVLNCEIDYKENDVVLSDEEECVKAGIRWQMQKESIPSKDLEELINSLSKRYPEMSFAKLSRIAVRVAKWKVENLWKPADGDDLPEIDREVIVLIKYNAQRNVHDKEYSTYRVGFGHRPNPNGWDGKNIDTNEVTHYTPKLYDKGCWNAPDIVYWLDIELPKEIEL